LVYSEHHVALGRSGLWQAVLQFHLQLSQRKTFIPRALLILSLNLSTQLGFFRLVTCLSASVRT